VSTDWFVCNKMNISLTEIKPETKHSKAEEKILKFTSSNWRGSVANNSWDSLINGQMAYCSSGETLELQLIINAVVSCKLWTMYVTQLEGDALLNRDWGSWMGPTAAHSSEIPRLSHGSMHSRDSQVASSQGSKGELRLSRDDTGIQ